jgi:hypothetical protein
MRNVKILSWALFPRGEGMDIRCTVLQVVDGWCDGKTTASNCATQSKQEAFIKQPPNEGPAEGLDVHLVFSPHTQRCGEGKDMSEGMTGKRGKAEDCLASEMKEAPVKHGRLLVTRSKWHSHLIKMRKVGTVTENAIRLRTEGPGSLGV